MCIYNKYMFIPDLKAGISINPGEVIRIEAMSNYCRVFMANGKNHIVTKLLRHFEVQLANDGFVRIHRSHLVNIKFIQSFNFSHRVVRIYNHEQLEISRRKLKSVKEKLNTATQLIYPFRQRRVA